MELLSLNCSCGEPVPHGQCCGPIIDGIRPAITATALMRSRYSAFAIGGQRGNTHLLRSWDPATRPDAFKLNQGQVWTGLTILNATGGGPFDSTGTVSFQAKYRAASVAPSDERAETNTQSETSSFRRVNGLWVYTDGVHF